MRTVSKLSAEERRAAIVKAVRKVFAEKGFHGTTTRALADAAGVSEALLFKHFPTKEALFAAMQVSCCSGPDAGRFERIAALEPSASTLVLMVHFLVALIVGGSKANAEDQAVLNRLMLRSLAEDGEFARLLLGRLSSCWVPKVEECVRAAVAAGEAAGDAVRPNLGGWFTHHLACMVSFCRLPDDPVVDYKVGRDRLVEQTVWFALRGMGLKDEAIRRYYNPKALALFGD
jgi:AcrR family transcriptional regulator